MNWNPGGSVGDLFRGFYLLDLGENMNEEKKVEGEIKHSRSDYGEVISSIFEASSKEITLTVGDGEISITLVSNEDENKVELKTNSPGEFRLTSNGVDFGIRTKAEILENLIERVGDKESSEEIEEQIDETDSLLKAILKLNAYV